MALILSGGSLGKPPGSIVKIINDSGVEQAPGEEGHIASAPIR